MKKVLQYSLFISLLLSCEQPLSPVDQELTDDKFSSVSESSVITFAKNYGSSEYDESTNSVVKTSDGGYAIFGTLLGPAAFYLIKTDKNGNLLWQKTYGTEEMRGECLRQTPDGGFIMIGNSEVQVKVIKTNKEGSVQWVWSGNYYEYGNSIALSGDNGYVGVGSTFDSSDNAIAFKLSSSGILLWKKKYAAGAVANSIERISDNGFIVAGTAIVEDKGPELLLFRIDKQGNMQWQKTWGGNYDDEGNHAIQTSDGGFAVVGYNGKSGNSQVYLIKTDSKGKYQWIKGYFPSTNARGNKILQTSDKGFAIAGYVYSKAALIKVSSNGSYQWRKNYNSDILGVAEDIISTSDGGYALTGLFTGAPLGWQAALVKTDSKGNY